MKFNGNKIGWTPNMKSYTENSLTTKLDRIVSDFTETEVRVTRVTSGTVKVDVTIGSYRAQSVGEDFYFVVDEVGDKLKSIITRSKKHGKIKKISVADYTSIPYGLEDPHDYDSITKEKLFILDPISLDEAIREFDMTDYNFYVFKDIDNDNDITILYKRYDNSLGLIRCK